MIRVKRIGQHDLPQPRQETPGAAGYDLRAAKGFTLYPGQRKVIHTGFAWQIPLGMVGQVWPRSGTAVKQGLDTLAGVIDSDFRGEIGVVLINHGEEPVSVEGGDRIAQLLIVPCYQSEMTELVFELEETKRGVDAYGSTGKA